jgi:hypothetical protein
MRASGAWEQGLELAQAVATGDAKATRHLLRSGDWRPGAMFLAMALVDSLHRLGDDPVATLRSWAEKQGDIDAHHAELGRALEEPSLDELRAVWWPPDDVA